MKPNLIREYVLAPLLRIKGAVLTLLTGTAASQMVLIIASPVLTRLYDPATFGQYAYVTLVLSILIIFATGKFELAILLQKDEQSAGQMVALALTCTVLTSATAGLASVLVMFTLSSTISSRLSMPVQQIGLLSALAVLLIALNAIQSIFFIWMNRKGWYKGMSSARITHSLVMVVAQVVFAGWVGGLLGLMLGAGLALLGSIVIQFHCIKAERRLFAPDWPHIISLARLHKNLPLHTIPTDMISTLLSQAPVYFLGVLYSSTVVGNYNLAQRILQAPMQLISTTVGEVFRREASAIYQSKGECREYFVKTTVLLTCVAGIIAVVVAIAAEHAFSIAFGEAWVMAGHFASIIIVMFALKFVASPLSFMFFITNNTRLDLILHSTFLCILFIAFWTLKDNLRSPEMALWLFVATYSALYLSYFFLSYRFSKGCLVAKHGDA